MKIYQLFNQYRSVFGGEEVVVKNIDNMLRGVGVESKIIIKNSKEIKTDFVSKISLFYNGIYNKSAYLEILDLLKNERPDLVHVHNLYPLFSPSVLVACRSANIPVVMTIHNFLLTCPNWFHLRNGAICERCVSGKEYQCVLTNCRGDIFESIAYTSRMVIARKLRLFQNNISLFIALSEFSKYRLIDAGYIESNIVVLPNTVKIPASKTDLNDGKYIAYAGRLSEEKGIDLILQVARKHPELPFRIAGDGPLRNKLMSEAPGNVIFVGMLDSKEIKKFYREARMLVLPSICLEVCPLVLLEAMSYGLPVVAARIGGIPEIVTHNETGLLFEPKDVRDMWEKIERIWRDSNLSKRLGDAARESICLKHNNDGYAQRLTSVYEETINSNRLKKYSS